MSGRTEGARRNASLRLHFGLFSLLSLLHLRPSPASAAKVDDLFRAWLENDLWPDAKSRGISRATFDAAFAGVTPEPRSSRSRHAGPEGQDAEEAAPGRVRLAGQLFRRKDHRRGDRRRPQPRRQIRQDAGRDRKGLWRPARRRARHLGPRDPASARPRFPTMRSRCSAPRPSCRRARTCSARRCWPPSKSSRRGLATRGQMKSSWAGALRPAAVPALVVPRTRGRFRRRRPPRHLEFARPMRWPRSPTISCDYGWVRGRDWGFEVTVPDRRFLRAGRPGPGPPHFGMGGDGHCARQRQAVPGQRGACRRLFADAGRPQRSGLHRHAEFLRAQGIQ